MRKFTGRLAAAAAVLTLVTTCLLGGTLAKYTTSVNGTGTAEVAAWSFQVNGSTAQFDVDLSDTSTKKVNVAEGKIAPGSEGKFDIKVDGKGSDVAIDYTIAFSELQNKPANLEFYSDAAYGTKIPDLAAYDGLNGTIAVDAVGTPVTKTVFWKWDYSADNAGTTDNTETGSMTFKITVTGTQKAPAAS
ncbi:hypothetical protein LQE92_11550 [Lacrimispora sp. NSJ-141]|uniref:Uncharacterized protein n=1 Tax=Lientehia hominis TaxID=2897778 RepID=A0AAP2WAI2_9FIRM|nr:hypothetical protein [Lientehia hominis]MCD2493254.1 hypothetical protein [Lientehia hominis]